MSDRVSINMRGQVADVRLNRPEKLNALDPAMFSAIAGAAEQLAERSDVRAVVLSGNGRAFCAGLDFKSFAAMVGDGDGKDSLNFFERRNGAIANSAQLPGFAWRQMPVPVIAAVHGVAYGGGIQIAAGADIRMVAPDARLSIREMYWGLIPDMSGTRTLRDILPMDVLKELVFTGRIISGIEAGELGLATHVVEDPLAAALELAEEIAANSPHAVRAAKLLLNDAYRVGDDEGLALEARLQKSLLGTPNQNEAVSANLENRQPRFADPE